MTVDQKISFGVKRFDDQSGNTFDVCMKVANEGRTDTILVAQDNNMIWVSFEDWPVLRKAIDDGVTAFKKLSSDLYTLPTSQGE